MDFRESGKLKAYVLRMSGNVLKAPSKSWLTPCLLLDLRRGEAVGYELRRSMSGLGFRERRRGDVYQTLNQMEDEGMVFCNRDGDDYEVPERSYAITEAGRSYLDLWAESLTRYRQEINSYFEAYERIGQRSV